MGIKGLSNAVRRYGRFSLLGTDTVVIDGPALVHTIFEGCMRHRPPTNGFICQPSYSTLGRLVISWLEELRAHNVTIRKIFFDGYLPPSKWPVRRERLLRQSQSMKALLNSHPHGSSSIPEGAFGAVKGGIALTQTTNYSSHSSWLPKSPFLVPAVIEILKSCRTWGPLVEVVSGEADMFCAEDVRCHGGILLTTDSDLLITDLGIDGNVSFFSDIVCADPSDKSQGLVACKFSLNTINNTLGLSNVGGLPRVAFEKVRCRTSFNRALEQVRNNRDNALELPEFQTFMEEYCMKEYLPKDHPLQRMLSTLDPRISEIIIQALLLDGSNTLPNASNSLYSRGPETLAIFLPILIEDRSRRSAWTMSTFVRQFAYSIMQMFAVHESPVVIEYRLLDPSNSSMGRQIDVLGLEHALEQCCLLVDVLEKLTERVSSVDMRWLVFTIYQDHMWSISEERVPLSASLLHQVNRASNEENQHSWDAIHFTAQVQASLYSLRLAKQVIDVAMLLCPELPPLVRTLREHLSKLPPIADWPTVENISRTLAIAKEANILSAITDINEIPAHKIEGNLPEPDQPKKRNNGIRKNKNRLLRCERDPNRPISINPFAILSNASLN
ncbi:hypothetical protein F5Y09DRAFT_257509 [Xylaria sp. FL1042]|nr:hypothetical protein F5Y09DRAFT_257509 [Xylaria sp. FL1042]